MEEQETIDVLMATYNGEKYIKEQIESILNQTYKNIHLIISDDGSKDNTVQILKEYENKDKRVTVYVQKQNLGYIKNFEFLLTKIENDIYMLSDQDDVWKVDKIENTYNKLKEEKADLVFSDLEVVDSNLKQIYPSFNDYMKLTKKIKKCDGLERQYLYNCMVGCTIMSKKQFVEKILPLPSKSKYLVHDMWIGVIVSIYGKSVYLDEKTIYYRQHGNNQIGTEKPSQQMTKFKDVRKFLIEIKLGIFEGYVENNYKFPKEIQNENLKSLNYYNNIKNKKNINFKNWKTFHKLYKNETRYYYLLSFIIMNFPFLGRILFSIKKIKNNFLKMKGSKHERE